MSREDGGPRRSAEEIAREHERMQREAENAKPTEGGLTPHEINEAAHQQQRPDQDRLDREDEDEARAARSREAWGREERESREAAGETDGPPSASILDSIEPRDPREAIAEAFGGGAAGRAAALREREPNQGRLMRVAALGLGLAGAFILWQILQAQRVGTGPAPTPVVATASASATAPAAQPTQSVRPIVQQTAAPTTTPVIGIVCGLPGGPTCPPRP